ncbi:MAG: hypothetical protein U0792_13695 [Gemmataceae bacterium]
MAYLRLMGGPADERTAKNSVLPPQGGQFTPSSPAPAYAGEAAPRLEPVMALTDEELKGLTVKFRERLKKGETLDQLLPEAFAACREVGRRT